MADLRVDAEFLMSRLLPHLYGAKITGARWDDGMQSVILTVDGPDVPTGCAEVMAIVTAQQETVRLEPVVPVPA